MRKKYFILIILAFLGISLNAQQKTPEKHFYYYKGEKFYLEVDYSRISVVSEGKINMSSVKKVINLSDVSIKNEGKSYTRQNVKPIDKTSNEDIIIAEIELSKVRNEVDYFDIIQHLSKESNVIKASPTYTVSNQKLGVSNNFYVKLFKEEEVNNLFDLAKKHFIQVVGRNEFMPLWFTLSCGRETPLSAIEAANLFYETRLFECAEPELLHYNLLASNDTYYSNQWGLYNIGSQYVGIRSVDISVEEAWGIATGSNTRVAVFDQGFEMNHPDLAGNTVGIGYDADNSTPPAQVRGSHGTACAGIIGAIQNNGQGISGVAPNAGLISISCSLTSGNTPQQLANGFNWAWQNGADVISNSWGGYTPSNIIDNAITNTLTQGRNGRGTVVVFASGNENSTQIRYPGNSNPNILVVGAISPCGERKNPNSCDGENWGSNYGWQLDVVAPGVLIPTTDRQGTNGYNPNEPIHIQNGGSKVSSDYANRDYTVWFNGTSSACPHVAGVAALMLSANPDLTEQQVRDIIERTTKKGWTNMYSYATVPGRPNGEWNNEIGYGMVNAGAAVRAACNLAVHNFSNRTVTTNTTVAPRCGDITVQNVTVTNGAKLTLDAADEITIERDFEVAYGSELEIK